MILLDANLLIYAYDVDSSHHAAAQEWLDRQLNELPAVGFPWESISAFLRVVSNPRIYPNPAPIADAWRTVRNWLSCEAAWIPQATVRHTELLDELVKLPGLRANLIPDAHLAAVAIGHGLTLCSADTGFARFPRLSWLNPLAA